MLRIIILCCFSMGIVYSSQGQRGGCAQSPAPCPHSTEISVNTDIAKRTKDNDTYLQELEMENKVRNLVTDEMQRIAKAKEWSVYELNESGTDGPPFIFISYNDWEATPFNKRPPDRFQITFIFITNKDSLQAWQNYLRNDVQSQTSKLVQQYRQSQNNNPLLKTYQDSILYYSQQMSELTRKYLPAYERALQNKDEAGIKAYENKEKVIRQKSDYFTNRLNDIQNESNKSFEDAQADWARRIVAFAEGSMALIHFDINAYAADFALGNADKSNISRYKITVPGAFHASITNNPAKPHHQNYDVGAYDFTFQNPSCVGTILFGKYLPGNSDHIYSAAFAKNYNSKAGVLADVKTINCDKVQTMQAHVEGGNHYVNEIINALDWGKLATLLYR